MIRISRRDLFLTVLLILPAFVLGEWLSSLCGLKVFSFHDVYEGFWGALALGVMLALTRGESC